MLKEPTDSYYLAQKENMLLAQDENISEEDQLRLIEERKEGMFDEDWVGRALASNPSISLKATNALFKEFFNPNNKFYFDYLTLVNLFRNESIEIEKKVKCYKNLRKYDEELIKNNPNINMAFKKYMLPVLEEGDKYLIEALAGLVKSEEDQLYIFERITSKEHKDSDILDTFCLNKYLADNVIEKIRNYTKPLKHEYSQAIYNLDVQRHKTKEEVEKERQESFEEILPLFGLKKSDWM